MPGKCHGFRNDNIVLMKWKTPLVFSQTPNASHHERCALTPYTGYVLFYCVVLLFIVEINRFRVHTPSREKDILNERFHFIFIKSRLTFLHIYLCVCVNLSSWISLWSSSGVKRGLMFYTCDTERAWLSHWNYLKETPPSPADECINKWHSS